MSSVNQVSTSSRALTQLLEKAVDSQTDLAKKMVKVAVTEKLQAQNLSELGQNIDAYA
ncbi:MAG: hypothetical protein GX221_04015 [Candidatus Riflebacteria bacterium]|nr:hypothetical protein [Candidatus Riflebacteria bacterium]